MNLIDLSIGDNSTPPWETPTFTESPIAIPEDNSEEETLEIYKKAARFEQLKLISGNTVSPSAQSYIQQHYGIEGLQRLKVAEFLLKLLHLRPSDDMLLSIACNKSSKIVVATAGAGKTTTLQLDLIVSKLIDVASKKNNLAPVEIGDTGVFASRILYLNYNKHNVEPITQRHNNMCAAVNKVVAEKIDPSLESSTVHAFCHKWLTAFATSLGLGEIKIASDEVKAKMWVSIITPRWKKYYDDDSTIVDYTVLDELYTFKTESLQDWDTFFESTKFTDSGLKSDFVKACIKKYDSMKKQLKILDFTDYISLTIELLRNNPEAREKILSRYAIVIADEAQDFTALMNELLLELDYPGLKKIIVGDPDQTIYAFKGVSPDNIVSLYERLPDCDVLGLDTNYRCPDRIVDAAKSILNLNILRFDKPINTVRTGGHISFTPCDNHAEQVNHIMTRLKSMSEEELGRTVIAFRNNDSGMLIAEELYYANIPYVIVEGRRPFQNPIFRNITTLLSALRKQDDFESNTQLYRVLPYTKDAWTGILTINKNFRTYNIQDIQFPSEMPRGTMKAYATLKTISTQIADCGVNEYIGALISLYRTYYFDFVYARKDGGHGVDDHAALMLDRAYKFFDRPITFDAMMDEYVERSRERLTGVTLSTFHGLKGLEFDTVFALDMNESLFPDYEGIEQKYTVNTAKEEKESENRLCYVLVTRAIKELVLLYNKADPSVYIDIIRKGFGKEEIAPREIQLGAPTISSISDSKMAFIRRMTLGRGGS